MAEYDYTRVLAANEEIILDCAESNRFQVLAGDADFYVKPDGNGRIKTELGLGQKVRRGFNKLWVQNGSTAQTISIKIGDDEIIDNRMVGTVDISGGIRLVGSDGASYGAVDVGTTVELISPADASRSSLLIQNLGSDAVFVGTDNLVDASTGIRVPGGGSTSLTVQTAVYAIAESGTQNIRYLIEGVA